MTDIHYTSNKPYLFRAILDWLLDNEATPYILVDANCAQVEVPQAHVKDGQIVLNINPSAVQNWHVDQHGISFNARFSGAARQIYVPMIAVMAIYSQENGQGMAFPPMVQEKQLDSNQSGATDESDSEKPNLIATSADLKSDKIKASKVAKLKSKNNAHLKVVK